MKCLINSSNEITGFWTDETSPENALECDKSYPVHGMPGEGDDYFNQTFFYKLVDGKVITTEAGKVWTAQEYARNRATEYPAITDQLDEIYHSGIDSWKAVIKVTKDKYPKG